MRNLIKTFILMLMLMLSFSHSAIADDFEDGLVAYGKGDFATALRLLTPLAEQENSNAQFLVGWIYERGEGVKKDYKIAVKWYTLAAEQGFADAQYNLARMYRFGYVGKDYKTAVKWYTLAAEKGHISAQSTLGSSYYFGQGVAQDYVKAHMWWNIAALNGDAEEINNRDFVAKKMTPAQIEKAQEAASRCIKQNLKNCD